MSTAVDDVDTAPTSNPTTEPLSDTRNGAATPRVLVSHSVPEQSLEGDAVTDKVADDQSVNGGALGRKRSRSDIAATGEPVDGEISVVGQEDERTGKRAKPEAETATVESHKGANESAANGAKPVAMEKMDVDGQAPAAETSAATAAPSASEPSASTSSAPETAMADGSGAASGAPAAADSDPSSSQPAAAAPAQSVQMRALIVTQDASIIIGKGGKHINEIREKSGARATISEAIPHNPERILTVSGPLDAVSKAFGLIVRRINDEPYDVPSVPGSRAVTIRFVVPNSRMGGVIGKAGGKIREIQEMSGARVQASEALLPGSTERILSVSGVADAVHIAVYYIGLILAENLDRAPPNTAYRPARLGGPGQDPLGGAAPPRGGGAPYGNYAHNPYSPAGPGGPIPPPGAGAGPAPIPPHQQPGSQTQQIYIPNELVGAVIGKGGAKINEIRSVSGSFIKIMEPGEGGGAPGQPGSPNERVSIVMTRPVDGH